MKWKPTFDNVIVERDIAEGRTKGGIIVPDAAKSKTNRGTVIASGPGRLIDGKLQKAPAQAGERVIFLAYAGSDIEMDDKEYVLLAAKDVVAVQA